MYSDKIHSLAEAPPEDITVGGCGWGVGGPGTSFRVAHDRAAYPLNLMILAPMGGAAGRTRPTKLKQSKDKEIKIKPIHTVKPASRSQIMNLLNIIDSTTRAARRAPPIKLKQPENKNGVKGERGRET